MKVYRTVFIWCMLFLMAIGIFGCGKEVTEDAEYYIYYLNKENTRIIPVAYEVQGKDTHAIIKEFIDILGQEPDSVEYQKALRGSAQINAWNLEKGQLQLNFNSDYLKMDAITEVLCRAALVRTLIQTEGVDSISFSIGDAPLMDKNGKAVGLMTAESFIENPGEQINSIQTATITLYFADKEGTGLISEVQECHYNSNIPLEKLVMEQLMKGPVKVDGMSVIPSGTKLVSVSVLDGVCFVNLDAGFLNQNYEIEEGVIIYSIVNSLAELTHVNKVQISVNGDTSITYREKFSLSNLYERNLDLMVQP